jgi:8-oxo-dGTP pyrophosphatase MutT (NUDIX family)
MSPVAEPGAARTALRRSLDVAEVATPDQERVRRRMQAFAAEHRDALLRSCRPGHFTGSALVVDPSRGVVLVLWHRKLQRWLQPGGHADGVGDLARVALREAVEETGIEGLRVVGPAVDLDVHEVRPPGEEPHLHLDLRYVVVAPPGAQPVGNHESEALRWVGEDELVGLGADDGLRRLARAGLDALGRLGERVELSRDPGASRRPPCG